MINWQDYEGRQPLHCAVTDSTDAVVAAIIKYSSILTKKKNDCVSSRSPSCMLNALDNRLRSALHWAALVGRPSLVQMLLDRAIALVTECLEDAGITMQQTFVRNDVVLKLRSGMSRLKNRRR